ncbi:MAG: ATP-binding cassette domain-containing protein [Verrucomicrobiales bacterium]
MTAEGEEIDLLKSISFSVEPGSLVAIVGPSGCGKTTLLKTIAGFHEQTDGTIVWNGRCLMEEEDFEPTEVGYVPQFSIAYDLLTVVESVRGAVQLRVRLSSRKAVDERVEGILEQTGMLELRDLRVAVLSGGQKRRLGLAMELASNPRLLLCDEVTSGLDLQSEREIVELMHKVSRVGRRIVLNVTHSFGGIELMDTVLVLYRGRVVYHGTPEMLPHYFSVESVDRVYERLRDHPAVDWHEFWRKHCESYVPEQADTMAVPETRQVDGKLPEIPGFFRQLWVLLGRKRRLFTRDRGQLVLHLALMLGFPLLVVIFAIDGVGQMPKSPLHGAETSLLEAIEMERQVIGEQIRIGGLISGLVMFQIILLTLTGANNSAREIAAERLVYEKEKFAGLRPMSYLISKVIFLGVLVLAQSMWMSVFVDRFCGLPGPLVERTVLLVLVNGAMTGICLGISSLMRTAEQASLMSIYLVGFQLPLSGAVLALSDSLEHLTQPFISAYWSWAGQLELMKQTDFFVGIKRTVPTELVDQSAVSVLVLSAHLAAGIVIAWFGLRRTQWH